MLSIRNSKQALTTLLARGSVGDELWQRFLRVELEMKEELEDVVSEANALAPGWGQHIFQSANEMYQNSLLRKRIAEVQAQKEADREWWDRKRKETKEEFMKELNGPEGEKGKGSGASTPARVEVASGDEGVVGDGVGGGKKKKKGKK
jgi:translocation protein SEC66